METVAQESTTAESRTATVSARVTPRERAALVFVAGALDTDVSNLLREHSISEIVARRAEIAASLSRAA